MSETGRPGEASANGSGRTSERRDGTRVLDRAFGRYRDRAVASPPTPATTFRWSTLLRTAVITTRLGAVAGLGHGTPADV